MGFAAAFRDGARACAPMLIGTVPFGMVAGASPVEQGLGIAAAMGFASIVFAGASQLAAIDVLGGGGSALVAIVSALTINMRMILYSASMAPHVVREKQWRRLSMAYLLTDQAYAVSIVRWQDGEPEERRVPFFLGAGLILWSSWQLAVLLGALIGPKVPDDLPLDFAVPLVFLVMLVPTLVSRPALAAAVAGGAAAVAAGELGGGDVAIISGALVGIAAGVAAELIAERGGDGDGAGTGPVDLDDEAGHEADLGLDMGPEPT